MASVLLLLAILDDQRDGDIAPRGVRVRTDLVGQLYQRLRSARSTPGI
jgi:hypothetical protein